MKGKMYIVYTILLALAFFVMYLMGKNTKRKKEAIVNEGIETSATVINRSITRNANMFESFIIKYDYKVNGKLIQGYSQFNDKCYYDNAIIGMKYLIKYLPDNPKEVYIYIDKPIAGEYRNIDKERERILNTYKDAKVNLKKNARPLNEIQYLIP